MPTSITLNVLNPYHQILVSSTPKKVWILIINLVFHSSWFIQILFSSFFALNFCSSTMSDWEVVGGKHKKEKPSNKKNAKKETQKFLDKAPKIEDIRKSHNCLLVLEFFSFLSKIPHIPASAQKTFFPYCNFRSHLIFICLSLSLWACWECEL